MDPVAQPIQPIGIEDGRPQDKFLRGLLRTLQGFWSKELHRLNRVLPKDGTEAMTGPLELFTYTVATLPDASDFTGSVIYVSDGGPRHSRALVKRTSTQSIPDATVTSMTWTDEIYDDGGWFTASSTDLVVPTGVTRVRIAANVAWDAAAGAFRQIVLQKNSLAFDGQGADLEIPTGVTLFDFSGVTFTVVDCVATDQFKVNVQQSSGAALNVLNTPSTYFVIEAVEFAEGYGGTFQGSNGTRWVPLG